MTGTGEHRGIDSARLRQVSLATRRGGYDTGSVDDYLDEVAEQLDLTPQDRTLTAAAVANQVFVTTRLRAGYDEQAVDALLDEVVARLRADELASAGSAPSAGGGTPSDDPPLPNVAALTQSTDSGATARIPSPGAAGSTAAVAGPSDAHGPAALPTVEPPTDEAPAGGDWEEEARHLSAVASAPRGSRFPMSGRFAKAYRPDVVDDLVERIVTWLPYADPAVGSGEVAATTLGETRPGYLRGEVDDWLARVAANLRSRGH